MRCFSCTQEVFKFETGVYCDLTEDILDGKLNIQSHNQVHVSNEAATA